MVKARHICSLPPRDTSGLPKLPPNASWSRILCRNVRKLFMLNPRHFQCRKLFRNSSSVVAERKRHGASRYSLVIHPLSTLNIILEVVFVITWLYSLILDPFTVFREKMTSFWYTIQWTLIAPLRMIIIVVLFNVGYIDQKTKKVVIERRNIAVRYLRTYFFFDLFASAYPLKFMEVLTNQGLVACSVDHIRVSYCYEVVFITRVVCCAIRLETLVTYIVDTLSVLGLGRTVRLVLAHLMRTFFYLHLCTFLIYVVPYLCYRGEWPPQSWLTQAKIAHSHSLADQYFQSFLMALGYFFGVSYRYEVVLMEEQICVAFTTIFGRIYTLYLLAEILNIFGIVGVSESLYEKQYAILQQYMAVKQLPENLRHRMLKYYEFKFQKHYFDEVEIVGSFSQYLRTELFLFAARKLLQKVELFKRLPASTIGVIVAAMKPETYSPKDVIVKLGSDDEDIFFISTGTVALHNKEGFELCHLEDGEEFGSSCLFSKTQMFTAVAVETTEVFTIAKDKFLEFLKPQPGLMDLFQNSVKAKIVRLNALGERMNAEVDLMSDLHSGTLLEARTMRFRVN